MGGQEEGYLDAEWDRYKTPVELGEKNLNGFMAHYFLTDGARDPSKTPWPLVLLGCEMTLG